MEAALQRESPVLASQVDNIIVLDGLSWADYQRLLQIRGDGPIPRMTYLEGRLELMTPSRSHESIKSLIGCLVEVWCLEKGVEFSTYGSWTIEDKDAERGAEPDECYVFGEVEDPRRPDLAIEVVWTAGGVDKLEVYRPLHVREIWFWEHGRIQPYVLCEGRYQAVQESEALPGLDLLQLTTFLDRSPTSRAIREYRRALEGTR